MSDRVERVENSNNWFSKKISNPSVTKKIQLTIFTYVNEPWIFTRENEQLTPVEQILDGSFSR